MTRLSKMLLPFALIGCASFAQSQQPPQPQPTETAPNVAGNWTGVWSSYNPAQGGSTPKDLCKNLTAKIEPKDGVWHATFEGDCGRPYKYAIKMEGRQVGKVVMFKGTSDLGKQDGGVYDWIGRANEKEFVGFFTSSFYIGTFNLARAPEAAK